MKIRILKRQKVEGEVGTICEVAPDRALFLLQCDAAEPVAEVGEQTKAPAKKKKGK